jgi:hypothetical protein
MDGMALSALSEEEFQKKAPEVSSGIDLTWACRCCTTSWQMTLYLTTIYKILCYRSKRCFEGRTWTYILSVWIQNCKQILWTLEG